MKCRRRWLVWVSIMLAVLAAQVGEQAQGSVNLPLHHWTYEAIERLVALGVIDRAMVVPKPYSRKEAARHVARAIELARGDRVPRDGREVIAEPLLYRLMQELRPELLDLGVVSNGAATRRGWIRYGGHAHVEVDSFQVGQGTVRFRENRGGEYYADGTQVQTDVRGWVELTDVVALSAQPKFISNSNTLGFGATNNSRNVFMRELNAKVSLFNIAVEVGRGSLWWGPGYHGSLLLTDHAFPLDRITLGSDEPFRLPWVFRSLGEWKLNSFLAQLERDRDFPRANVFGLRVSYLPASWLELGFTRLTQFDGRENPRGQSFPETVFDAYSNAPNQIGDLDVNEQFMVDLRAGVPRVPYLVPFPAGLQLYGELGSEDKWSKIPIPSRAAFLAGIYIPQVFRGSSTDLRIEYADTDFTRRKTTDNLQQIWYNNSTYASGMRFKGLPLGHHMGTDAIDVFVRTTRYLTDNLQLGTNFNLQERDRGQSPHETKREAAVDLTWWVSPKIEFTAGYTYQRIKNPGEISSINPFAETFTSGVTSTNHFLWTNLAVQF